MDDMIIRSVKSALKHSKRKGTTAMDFLLTDSHTQLKLDDRYGGIADTGHMFAILVEDHYKAKFKDITRKGNVVTIKVARDILVGFRFSYSPGSLSVYYKIRVKGKNYKEGIKVIDGFNRKSESIINNIINKARQQIVSIKFIAGMTVLAISGVGMFYAIFNLNTLIT